MLKCYESSTNATSVTLQGGSRLENECMLSVYCCTRTLYVVKLYPSYFWKSAELKWGLLSLTFIALKSYLLKTYAWEIVSLIFRYCKFSSCYRVFPGFSCTLLYKLMKQKCVTGSRLLSVKHSYRLHGCNRMYNMYHNTLIKFYNCLDTTHHYVC